MRKILFRGKPVDKAFGDKFIYGSLGVIREGLVAIYDCLEFTEDIIHLNKRRPNSVVKIPVPKYALRSVYKK